MEIRATYSKFSNDLKCFGTNFQWRRKLIEFVLVIKQGQWDLLGFRFCCLLSLDPILEQLLKFVEITMGRPKLVKVKNVILVNFHYLVVPIVFLGLEVNDVRIQPITAVHPNLF